jgi:hypothetical protein
MMPLVDRPRFSRPLGAGDRLRIIEDFCLDIHSCRGVPVDEKKKLSKLLLFQRLFYREG